MGWGGGGGRYQRGGGDTSGVGEIPAGWGGGDTGDKLFSQLGGVVRKSSQVMDQHLCTTTLVRLTSLLTVTQPK